MHHNTYIYVCVRVCVARLHIYYPFICICENRPGLCMRVPVCDGDGSAVRTRWRARAAGSAYNPKP